MDKLFWLRTGLLAGRTGPNNDPWQIDVFRDYGFSAILSVNDGEGVHETLIKTQGIDYANIPMSANAPALPGDREICLLNLPLAMEFIGAHLAQGPVLVHCFSGKDRTGMVLAAALIALEGLSARAAMNEVYKVRPIAFSAPGWDDFGYRVLSEFASSHQSTLSLSRSPHST